MRNRTLLLISSLFLLLGAAATLQSQENPMPVFADPVLNSFGLSAPSGQDTFIRAKLVDIDHDGVLEAFINMAENAPPLYEWRDFHFYENNGSNENPEFVFVESYPFGIPNNTLNWMWQFVDINGDGLEDLVTTGFIQNNPVTILLNQGNAEVPDFSGPFDVNPFGIKLPESEIDGSLLDGVAPTFADIDNDGDLDLFFGGFFANPVPDEAFYFSENTGTATDPQFAEPVKNPFGLTFPPNTGFHWEAFEDMDCDGDLDMYLSGPPASFYFYENTGTPETADFSMGWAATQHIPFHPMAGSFVDIGGDGDLDLIGGSPGIRFYENLSSTQASFSYTQDGHAFDFNDHSSDNATAWRWDFGDGTTSDMQNPQHTYSPNGTYEVCLTAWGDLPCSNTVCHTVYAPVFPWDASRVPNPFGLEGLPPFSIIRLRDFDGDEVSEAIVVDGFEVQYYENTGDDAAPNFEFALSTPFGMPPLPNPVTQQFPFDFIDIDGDSDLDMFFASFRGDGNPLLFLENTGTGEAPWFGDSQVEANPFGFVQPTSDSISGQVLGGFSWPAFVDIDADNDYDLFFSGRFQQPGAPVFDENIYFYRNDDPSGNGTSPQFTGPIKNPFNLLLPVVVPDAQVVSRFVDIDCDADWDLFLTYAGTLIAFFENTGTPDAPAFAEPPVVWWANNPPQPAGFNAFIFGDWMDIGGDGDMDYIGGSGAGTFYWENISNGTMACQGPAPVFTGLASARLDARLSLYPNPAGDILGISLRSDVPLGELEIEIFDMLGQRVNHLRRQPAVEALHETISLEGLADGVYVLKASSEGRSIMRKFIRMQ